MIEKLSGPMLAPRSGGPAELAVVLLHGYGSDGNDLIALGQHWSPLLPQALFVAPNAPEVCAENAFGYQWFPLQLDRTISRVEGTPPAAETIIAFLRDLWTQTGLTAAETVLAGFSQGAMMALYTALSLPEPVRGVIGFSGALIPPVGFEEGRLARPPVCLVHGDLDQVVAPDLSAQAAAALVAQGHEVSHHVSAGTGHGIAPDGLDFATRFLLARAAATG